MKRSRKKTGASSTARTGSARGAKNKAPRSRRSAKPAERTRSASHGACLHLEGLRSPPREEELDALRRRGWRKRRNKSHPELRVLSGGHPALGTFELHPEGKDHRVEFTVAGATSAVRTSLQALCDDPALAAERLAFGWLVGNLFTLHAMHLRDEIPGPSEAMAFSAPYFSAASEWHAWAIG